MRKALVLTIAAAAIGGGLATPALAACGANALDKCSGVAPTTVAFTVLPDLGSISILPSAAAVGAGGTGVAPSSTGLDNAKRVVVSLGPTSVVDGRSASPGWSVSATAGAFTLAASTSTIAASKATFSVPVAPGVVDPAALTTLGVTGTFGQSSIASYATPTSPVANGSVIVSSNSTTTNATTFIPQMTVDVTGAPAGLYAGSVTQSVS